MQNIVVFPLVYKQLQI